MAQSPNWSKITFAPIWSAIRNLGAQLAPKETEPVNIIKMKTLAEIQALDPNSIRQFLKDLRGVVAFLSQLTPTEYDDMLLTWLDLLLGTAPGAQGVLDNVVGNIPWDKLPWDKIMQYVLPALMQLVQKWIDSLGKGGNTTTPGMKFSSLARCA